MDGKTWVNKALQASGRSGIEIKVIQTTAKENNKVVVLTDKDISLYLRKRTKQIWLL